MNYTKRTNMKPIISSLIILLLLSGFHPAAKAQENEDAVFLKMEKEYILNADGSWDYHYYKKLKLLTHMAFNRLYGETFIVYNPAYQKLRINRCVTTMADGKVIEAPANAFNEVLPGFAANTGAYNHLREMVVTHTGLEVGAVIELDYTITSAKDFLPGLMGNEVIGEWSPVNELKIIVRLPAGKDLQYRVLNIRTAPQVSEENGMKVHTFTFTGLKARSHEPFQARMNADMPRLIFSSVNGQQACDYLVRQPGFSKALDKGTVAAVKKIREENKEDRSAALKLQSLVANDINTLNIPPELLGYRVRTASETWKSNGGTELEKCLLLTGMLSEAGINAEIVAAVPAFLFDQNLAFLPLVDHYLVQANPREDKQMYLSATSTGDQNLVYDLGDLTILPLNPQRPLNPVKTESGQARIVTKGELSLNDSLRMTGKLISELYYKCNPFFSLKNDEKKAKSLLSGAGIKEAAVINLAQERSTIEYSISSNNSPGEQAGYYFLELPRNGGGTKSWGMSYLNSSRQTTLEIPYPLAEEYSYTLDLPVGMKLINPTPRTEMAQDCGMLLVEIVQKDNRLSVTKKLDLTLTKISPSGYKAFKKMMDTWNDKNAWEIILKK
jgi:hypothetical protein